MKFAIQTEIIGEYTSPSHESLRTYKAVGVDFPYNCAQNIPYTHTFVFFKSILSSYFVSPVLGSF
jgi:hypothetical protein